jgi:hypothetical protein
MSLEQEIDKMRKEIRTDGYPMSIGEWISLYEDSELDIHPEFQRFYRWTEQQKSNLIESILLGIPIPPIFVSQRKTGVWDVVDGLQRLSTVFQLIGILKDENDEVVEPLVLRKTKYLPSLQNKKWEDTEIAGNSLSAEQRLLIKRSKLSVSILLRESDEIAKYELFQRLNTGGSELTPQEVRNCILVMVNRGFYEWLRTLASVQQYQDCIALSEKNISEQYDIELVLRFLVFSRLELADYDRSADVGDYLTDSMVKMARDENFDRSRIEGAFRATFQLLSRTIGENAFRRYDSNEDKFKGGFLLSPYEVIACGLGYNFESPPGDDQIEPRIKSIWTNPIFTQNSGSGVRANTRIPQLIPLGRETFRIENSHS